MKYYFKVLLTTLWLLSMGDSSPMKQQGFDQTNPNKQTSTQQKIQPGGQRNGRSLKRYVLLNSDNTFRIRDLSPAFSLKEEQKISNGIIVNDGGAEGRILQSDSSRESPIIIFEARPLDQISQETQFNIHANQRGVLRPLPLSSFESGKISDSLEELDKGREKLDLDLDLTKEIFLPKLISSQQPLLPGRDDYQIGSNSDVIIKGSNTQVLSDEKASIFLHVPNQRQTIKKIEDILDSREDLSNVNIPGTIAIPQELLTPPKPIRDPSLGIEKKSSAATVRQDKRKESDEDAFFEPPTAKILKPLHDRRVESRILAGTSSSYQHNRKDFPLRQHHHQSEGSDLTKYSFGYKVTGKEGATHSHREERNGRRVEGRYHVDLPNGFRQIVEYYADETGYHPTITYEKLEDTFSSDSGLPDFPRHIHEHTHIHNNGKVDNNRVINFPRGELNGQKSNLKPFGTKVDQHPTIIETPPEPVEPESSESRIWIWPSSRQKEKRPYFHQHDPRFDQPAFFIRNNRKYVY